MPTVSELIEDLRGGRSYLKLEEEAGGAPSASRWHQLHKKPLTELPTRSTLEGIAKVLRVSNFTVLRACAESFTAAGLDDWDTGPQRAELLDRLGAYDLTKLRSDRVEAIMNVITVMLRE